MLFMVIEHYKDVEAVYKRFHARGRLMPEGVEYINSWVTSDGSTCYQINDCRNEEVLLQWTKNWEDLVDFEYYPVLSSQEMSVRMARDVPAGGRDV